MYISVTIQCHQCHNDEMSSVHQCHNDANVYQCHNDEMSSEASDAKDVECLDLEGHTTKFLEN